MNAKKTAGCIALALSLMSAGTAFAAGADGPEWMQFSQIMAMKMMDKDKDGMVSKTEYMDMMTKAWEMNAAKMGVKGDKMTSEQYKQFQHYLQAGAGG
jgi:hypothetical protein